MGVSALCLVLVSTSCGSPLYSRRPAAQPAELTLSRVTTAQAARPSPSPQVIDSAAVLDAVRETAPAVTPGLLVFDRDSGTSLLEANADRRFRAASLTKLLISIDLLSRAGGPSAGVKDHLRRMLELSDDEIASRLWVEHGRGAIVTRAAQHIGLSDTSPPENPGRWGDTRTTPRDVLRIYRHIRTELPAGHRELIVSALAKTRKVAADGWNQHFGIPDGMSLRWAVKQGWSDSPEDNVVHSTGLVGPHWRYVVVLLAEAPAGTRWTPLRAAVTAAASAIEPQLPGG
ncbi:serine hydrolase [Amycolatopsis aidingensis]|uniref:serine hydrolase n=1 Tax=Amycolatopsis aidingensis TaxID=2842453 RepID=UPI001C0A9758|nr:serine hydrolase [Amycolatopsis aidingensis]